jgi:choline dehydrogenase-like flavoprotein
MLVTFIPAADALGVSIYAECTVDEILVERRKTVGVRGTIVDRETRQKRGSVTVKAPVVILAAGTFGSPLILETSGVDDQSGACGKNLVVHPAGGAHGRMAEDVSGWKAIPQGYYVSEWEDRGIMLEGGFGPPEVIGLVVPGYGREYQDRMADYRKMISFGAMVTDEDSVGSVHSVAGQTVIRYQLGERDKSRLLFGWKKVLEILFAAGAREVYTGISGFDILTGPEQIEAIDPQKVDVLDLTLSAYHPMGTCRMGRDPRKAVVDSYLESHAVKGLFVTDGSVFPTALGVNPQASIMAFAARTADYLVRNQSHYF